MREGSVFDALLDTKDVATWVARRLHHRLLPVLLPHALVHGARQGAAGSGAGDGMKTDSCSLLLLVPLSAPGGSTGYRLDHSPHDPRDLVSLQSGARTYVNYCLGCHSMQYMRYSSLTDIGLTEAQIKDYLLFTGEKVGEPMKVAARGESGQDLVRRQPARPVGDRARARRRLAVHLPAHVLPRPEDRDRLEQRWCIPNVAMPHALWTLQGERALDEKTHKLTELSKGTQSVTEYDTTVRDLVNFLVYASEPAAHEPQDHGHLWCCSCWACCSSSPTC